MPECKKKGGERDSENDNPAKTCDCKDKDGKVKECEPGGLKSLLWTGEQNAQLSGPSYFSKKS